MSRGHRGQGWYASRDMLRVRRKKNDPPLLGDFVFGYLVIAAAALVLLILLFVIGFSILDWAVNLLK